jgi:DNA-binding PadR family transcriptional regulator
VPNRKTKEVDDLLPLKPALYLILLALTDGDCHGYGLKKEIVRRTDGKVKLGAGTLYRSIRQLVDLELIEESDQRPDAALDDERRKYFRLTRLGRRAAQAETERLAVLVQVARASRLAG